MPHRFRRHDRSTPGNRHPAGTTPWSIRTKLLVSLLPAMVLILVTTGLLLHNVSTTYIGQAIERSSLTLTLAQAREMETLLSGCREALVALAHRPMTRERLRQFMEEAAMARKLSYAEAAYAGNGPGDRFVFLRSDDHVEEVPAALAQQAQNSPLAVSREAMALSPGQVRLSDLAAVRYPPMELGPAPRQRDLDLLRLTTPVADPAGGVAGYLTLSLDARALRNILSLYNSSRAPLVGFSRTTENRQSVFVDDQGWMRFQSEEVEDPGRGLSVAAARAGLTGDQGKPGDNAAFRPGPSHEAYWRMFQAIRQDRAGLEHGEPGFGPPKIASSDDFIGYAPVRFAANATAAPTVIGGVIYIDRSLLPRAAAFSQCNILLLATIGASITLAILTTLLAHGIARPLTRLTQAVREMRHEGLVREVTLPDSTRETASLRRSINRLVAALLSREVEIPDRATRLRPAGNIRFGDRDGGAPSPGTGPSVPANPVPGEEPAGEGPLSGRQRKALAALLPRKNFSRQDYQEAGGDIPQRTAQHDLQDLVNRGILEKDGRGPATRYHLRQTPAP